MLSIEPSENEVAESEGASRISMEVSALVSIVPSTHTGIFGKRRAATKRAS